MRQTIRPFEKDFSLFFYIYNQRKHFCSGILSENYRTKRKRKQKIQTSEQSIGDENLNASLMEPIPMTREELEEFKRKYTRDGRSKYAEFAER